LDIPIKDRPAKEEHHQPCRAGIDEIQYFSEIREAFPDISSKTARSSEVFAWKSGKTAA
jgi:hypothetical protein